MITHIMSDGTVRDSIQGVVVPSGHLVYRVLAELNGKVRLNSTTYCLKQLGMERGDRLKAAVGDKL